MKTITKTILTFLALGASAFVANAQNFGGPPPGGQGPRGFRPPPLPLVGVLDANHDHAIDAGEMANASAALLTLDKNGDGMLTTNEYMPPRPPRRADAGEGAFHPPTPAIVKALDANGDGVIDASEITDAPAALKALDQNGDGQLTPDEFCPRPPMQDGGSGNDNQWGPPDDGQGGPPPDQQ